MVRFKSKEVLCVYEVMVDGGILKCCHFVRNMNEMAVKGETFVLSLDEKLRSLGKVMSVAVSFIFTVQRKVQCVLWLGKLVVSVS
jgi:hypothetical protein